MPQRVVGSSRAAHSAAANQSTKPPPAMMFFRINACTSVAIVIAAVIIHGLMFPGWGTDDIPILHGKTALITGANAGLGFATAKIMANKGCRVLLACRSESKCKRAAEAIRNSSKEKENSDVEIVLMDLSEPDSIKEAASALLAGVEKLDYLINNAGVLPTKRWTNSRGWEMAFAVNHLGHYLLVGSLLELLKASKTRIVNHSSLASHLVDGVDLEDPFWERKPFNGMQGVYAQSKRANLLFTHSLNEKLGKFGITATACHPGGSKTKMANEDSSTSISSHILGIPGLKPVVSFILSLFTGTPEKGALPQIYAAVAAGSNEYIGPAFAIFGGPVKLGTPIHFDYLPGHSIARELSLISNHDTALDAERLWEKSEEITGMSYRL